MPKRNAFMFVDGENLTFRFQATLEATKRLADSKVVHRPDVLLWHPRMATITPMTLSRVNYYTSVVGDDVALRNAEQEIAKVLFISSDYGVQHQGQIVPHVYKKERASRKTRRVDINICIDSLRHARQPDIDLLILAGGDGDYLPLVQELMRQGKQVYLMAFESGIDERLKHVVDRFFSLDGIFFD